MGSSSLIFIYNLNVDFFIYMLETLWLHKFVCLFAGPLHPKQGTIGLIESYSCTSQLGGTILGREICLGGRTLFTCFHLANSRMKVTLSFYIQTTSLLTLSLSFSAFWWLLSSMQQCVKGPEEGGTP